MRGRARRQEVEAGKGKVIFIETGLCHRTPESPLVALILPLLSVLLPPKSLLLLVRYLLNIPPKRARYLPAFYTDIPPLSAWPSNSPCCQRAVPQFSDTIDRPSRPRLLTLRHASKLSKGSTRRPRPIIDRPSRHVSKVTLAPYSTLKTPLMAVKRM